MLNIATQIGVLSGKILLVLSLSVMLWLLGIPLLKETESFRPMVAVLGPELEKVDLPFKIPDGFGAVVYETINKKPIRKFHEPFTDTHSWILIEDIFQISNSGIHYVVIFSQKNERSVFL